MSKNDNFFLYFLRLQKGCGLLIRVATFTNEQHSKCYAAYVNFLIYIQSIRVDKMQFFVTPFFLFMFFDFFIFIYLEEKKKLIRFSYLFFRFQHPETLNCKFQKYQIPIVICYPVIVVAYQTICKIHGQHSVRRVQRRFVCV